MKTQKSTIQKITSDKIFLRLVDLLDEEHIQGCGELHCDIFVSFITGYELWAIWLFEGCGAASDEFYKQYKKLNKKYPDLDTIARAQADDLCAEIPHLECPHCNAVIWCPDGANEEYKVCGSCLGNCSEIEWTTDKQKGKKVIK